LLIQNQKEITKQVKKAKMILIRIAPSPNHRVQSANLPLDTCLTKKIKIQIKFLSDFLY
jgi:hypothetical protein